MESSSPSSKVYSANRRRAYEIYKQAKDLGQRPSDVAFFGDSVGPLFLRYFDRGIWAFGEEVGRRVNEAGRSENPVLARAQRELEWERLMGDGLPTSAFAEPSPGEDDSDDFDEDDEVLLGDEDVVGLG